MASERRYKLEISESQANVLVSALDLFSRIGLGQIEEVEKVAGNYNSSGTYDHNRVERLLHEVKLEMLGMAPHHSYGIMCPQVHEDFRIAWDIQQVVRDKISHREWFSPERTAKVPLPVIEEV